MARLGPAIGVALALALGSCGERTGNGTAAENNAAITAAAPPANAAAAREPCPFEHRNWAVTVGPSPSGTGEIVITVSGETRADAQGRFPTYVQQQTPPPEILLELQRDPLAEPQPDPGWSGSGIGYPYDPAYTHAVVRCTGNEIARLPIPRRGG